jgi:hypothetical protein
MPLAESKKRYTVKTETYDKCHMQKRRTGIGLRREEREKYRARSIDYLIVNRERGYGKLMEVEL